MTPHARTPTPRAHATGATWLDGFGVLVPDGWPAAVSARAQMDLALLADGLPLELTRAFYGEVRLGGGDDQTDVSLEIARTERRAWRDWIDAHAMPAVFMPEAESWRAIRRMLARWEADPALDDSISQLWIEFDRLAGIAQSAPSCFVGFRTDPPVETEVLLTCAHTLTPNLSRAREAALGTCVRALPDGAAVGQLGLMLARGDDAPLRLCIAGVPVERLNETLQRLQVPGMLPQGTLQQLLQPASDERDVTGTGDTQAPRLHYIDIDIADRIASRVGLELRCDRRVQARGVLRERTWLQRLATTGLVSHDWIEALTAWPRAARAELPHQFWPSIACRRLNHIKLLWEHGRMHAAKGYCLLRVADAPPRRPPKLPTATQSNDISIALSVPVTSVPRHPSLPSAWSRHVHATVPS